MSKKHIWIIGASSGIGRALAKNLAAQGYKLYLSARRQDALSELNEELGGYHKILPLDITNEDTIKKTVSEIDLLDSVICMSGTYKPRAIEEVKNELASAILKVNLLGPICIIEHILPKFLAQKSGQIVLCGSVAGYTGLPNAQPYGASKAGLINYAESLRAEMSEQNIDVKIINPGFVKTPMTDKNDFDMPFITTPEKAASVIAKSLDRKAFEIHTPKIFTYMMKLLHVLPYWLKMPLLKMADKDNKASAD